MLFVRKFNMSYTNEVPRFDIPTRSKINLFWCRGSMAGIAIFLQLIRGVLCSMDYVKWIYPKLSGIHHSILIGEPGPIVEGLSVELLRFFHLWGASLLFICLFIHMGRGIYYCSYSKNPWMWSVGVVLYIAIMAEAFLGYLLPWHQMSYWAGVVISSIFFSLPIIGPHLYIFLVGSYDFGLTIISRVLAAHIIFGLVILFIILIHIIMLHKIGSRDSFNSGDAYSDSIFFHKLFTRKDLFVWMFVIFITLIMTCYNPWLTRCKENFISPKRMSTPVKIKPEWYFLPFYAILRSIESKMGGLLVVVLVIFLFWLPLPGWFTGFESFYRRLLFWLFSFRFIFLGILGSSEPTLLCQWLRVCVKIILCLSLFLIKFLDYIGVFKVLNIIDVK